MTALIDAMGLVLDHFMATLLWCCLVRRIYRRIQCGLAFSSYGRMTKCSIIDRQRADSYP